MSASIDCAPASVSLAERIEASGYAIEPVFVQRATVAALRARVAALDASGRLHGAGVGRGAKRTVDAALRGDRIAWLDPRADDPAEQVVLAAFEALRVAVNRRLALGLFDLEAHYAIYPPGAGYAAHRDRFRDDDTRVLSCVIYLNEEWRADDEGALRLHLDDGVREILPLGGTLVAFMSDRFVHEVLPATRERVSLTAWLRRREARGC
jgi:SM-20-related protein